MTWGWDARGKLPADGSGTGTTGGGLAMVATRRSVTAGSLPDNTKVRPVGKVTGMPRIKKKAGAGKKAGAESCAGKGRPNLKGKGAGRPGVKCPSQGYKK